MSFSISCLVFFAFSISPAFLRHVPINCDETYTSMKGDTCFDVAVAYGLNLTELETKYDCERLQVGTEICVSEKSTCQIRFIMNHEANVTCKLLQSAYKISESELEENNGGIKCDSLPAGRRMCVWTADDRELSNTTCIQLESVKRPSSCSDWSRMFNLTIDQFMFLNPRVNCEHDLKEKSRLCVKDMSTRIPCSEIVNVGEIESCEMFGKQYNLTVEELLDRNPTLKCNKFHEFREICTQLKG